MNYSVVKLRGEDSPKMLKMLLSSRNVDPLKISKDIAASFKYGENFALMKDDEMVGVAGILDSGTIGSLSHFYVSPDHRNTRASIRFLYTILAKFTHHSIYVNAKNISTFRKMVSGNNRKKLSVEVRYIMGKVERMGLGAFDG